MFCLRRNINKYNQNKRCSLDQLVKYKRKNSIQQNRFVFDTPSENPNNSLPFNFTCHAQHQVTPKKDITSPFFSTVIAKPQQKSSGNSIREKRAIPNCLEKTRVNSLILDNRKNNKKEWNSVFKPYNNKKNQFDLKAFKRYFQEENANKFETTPTSVEDSHQNNQSLLKDKDMRRINSILIMKKIQRKREKIVQQQKQKYEQQFRSKNQVPIHHSQYQPIKKKNYKVQEVNDRRLRKADRLMTQFIKLKQTMNEQMWFTQKTQEPQMIKFVQGQHIQHRTTKKMNKFNSKSFTIAKRGNKKFKAQKAKVEEQQFGPWNRTFTGDFDHLF